MRGTLTSMGVQPPCPSSPLLARPQVYSSPLQPQQEGGKEGRIMEADSGTHAKQE